MRMIFRANIARLLGFSWFCCCATTAVEGAFQARIPVSKISSSSVKDCVDTASRASVQMSSAAASVNVDKKANSNVVRVLALHGSEGTGERFRGVFEAWQRTAKQDFGMDLQVNAIDAPVPKGQGFAWWSMPPFVRSFNATEYEYFDTSAEQVVQELSSRSRDDSDNESSSYDLVIGFSQGAILGTSLLALDKISRHPKSGYILIGGAWPNPFTRELESLTNTGNPSRVLLVVGEHDKINPPEHSIRIKKYLEAADYQVTLLRFPGGHSVPTKNDETLKAILSWIAAKSN